jgi:hypothetical protein
MTIKRTTAKKRTRTKKPASFSDTLTTAAPGKKRLPRPKENPRLRRSWLCASLTLCGLLGFASSAAAECTWVLWSFGTFPDESTRRIDPVTTRETRAECEAERRKVQGRWQRGEGPATQVLKQGGVHVTFQCFPDTVDPRGPKAR